MQSNIYVDTNIVVDICDSNRAKHENSFAIVESYLKKRDCELFINSDTLSNLFYILSNRSKLKSAEVLEKMHFINEIFTLVSIDSIDIEKALKLCANNKLKYKDYEDTMQYVCAKKINAKAIITNDKNFISEDIEIIRT